MATENRSSDRRPVSWRAKILLAAGQVLEARTTDIGLNGVGLILPKPLPTGLIQLALQMPGGGQGKSEVLTGSARVVFQVLRGDEYQVGVEWHQLDPAKRQLIRQYVEKTSQPQQRG